MSLYLFVPAGADSTPMGTVTAEFRCHGDALAHAREMLNQSPRVAHVAVSLGGAPVGFVHREHRERTTAASVDLAQLQSSRRQIEVSRRLLDRTAAAVRQP